MTENSQNELNTRVNNLFNNLQKNPKSIFYLVGHLSKTVLNKASKSIFDKDKVFVNLYNQLEDKNLRSKKEFLPIVTPFSDIKVKWTIRNCLVLVNLLSYFMLILRTLDFLQNLLLIQILSFIG